MRFILLYLADEGMFHNNIIINILIISGLYVFPVSLQWRGMTPVRMPGPAWNSWSGRSKKMPRWRDDLWPCQFSLTMLWLGMIFDEQSVIEEESLKLFIMGCASHGSDKLCQSKCCSLNDGERKRRTNTKGRRPVGIMWQIAKPGPPWLLATGASALWNKQS